jgi:eukaryotic-like serine/threonine-protein kinase
MTRVGGLPAWPSDLSATHRFQGSSAIVAAQTLAVGTGPIEVQRRLALGRFRIVADLGGGSMGEVMLAEDTLLGRRVAIKRLRAELLDDPGHRERLRNEARIAVQFDHPAIVRVLDLLCEDGADYIVMEYIPGPSLRTLRNRGALAIAYVVETACELTDALEHVHARGIIHRDLKLENVPTTRDGRPKLNDFGVACSVECIDGPGEIVGTPRAMSPEQVTGEPIDPRSDLFSLGVLLYELVAGMSPFAAEGAVETMQRVLHDPAPSLAGAHPDVPPLLASLIDRLLAKDPAHRPQSAHEVAARLHALIPRRVPRSGRGLMQRRS